LVRKNDPVPEDVLDSARESFELRSIDDELATLVYDSMIDDDVLAGVRSGGGSTRQLTFAARSLVLEMDVFDARHVVGQVVPPQAALVEVRHRGETISMTIDELGCFHIPVMPEGPVSIRCHPTRSGAYSVATNWITF